MPAQSVRDRTRTRQDDLMDYLADIVVPWLVYDVHRGADGRAENSLAELSVEELHGVIISLADSCRMQTKNDPPGRIRNLSDAVAAKDPMRVARILTQMKRENLHALALQFAARRPRPGNYPDDWGGIDEVAVRRAMNGEQRPLTVPERRVAIHYLKRTRGLEIPQIADRLRVSEDVINRVLYVDPPPEQLALFQRVW